MLARARQSIGEHSESRAEKEAASAGKAAAAEAAKEEKLRQKAAKAQEKQAQDESAAKAKDQKQEEKKRREERIEAERQDKLKKAEEAKEKRQQVAEANVKKMKEKAAEKRTAWLNYCGKDDPAVTDHTAARFASKTTCMDILKWHFKEKSGWDWSTMGKEEMAAYKGYLHRVHDYHSTTVGKQGKALLGHRIKEHVNNMVKKHDGKLVLCVEDWMKSTEKIMQKRG